MTTTVDDRDVDRRRDRLDERLQTPDAVLSTSDLRELGWSRRGVDAIMRACPIIVVPGFSRTMIRVADYLAYLERCTYRDGERVRA